jgi:hypothetical protein
MNSYLNNLVQTIRNGGDDSPVGALSTAELCFVAIAAERYDLLPATFGDPIEAWHRLDPDWRLAVCGWRGWPETYAAGG